MDLFNKKLPCQSTLVNNNAVVMVPREGARAAHKVLEVVYEASGGDVSPMGPFY